MQAYVRWTGRYLSFPGFTLRLNGADWRPLLLVSILPALVVCAVLIDLSLSYVFDALFLGAGGADRQTPDGWQRVSVASWGLRSFASPLALGVFFLAGIRPWSRAQGSVAFVIGTGLAVLALGLGLSSILMFAFTDVQHAYEFRFYTWNVMATAFAPLAAGYFFIAFRAGAMSQARTARRPQRRVRRTPSA